MKNAVHVLLMRRILILFYCLSSCRLIDIGVMLKIREVSDMGEAAEKENADMPIHAVIRYAFAAVRIALH